MGSIDPVYLFLGFLAALFFIDRSVKSRTEDYRRFLSYLEQKLDECNEFSKFCLLLGEEAGANGEEAAKLIQVATKAYGYREQIAAHFSVDEMRVIAFDLYGEESNKVYGDTVDVYSMRLLSYATRTGTIDTLINRCREDRPQVRW